MKLIEFTNYRTKEAMSIERDHVSALVLLTIETDGEPAGLDTVTAIHTTSSGGGSGYFLVSESYAVVVKRLRRRWPL